MPRKSNLEKAKDKAKNAKDKAEDKMDMEGKEMVIVGATIAALAVGAYFLTGNAGKKNRRKIRGWMVRMRGEVIDRLEDVREVTEPVYKEIVDTVAQAQIVSSSIPKNEILELAEDLKRDWKTITKLAKGNKTTAKSSKATSSRKKSKTKSTVKRRGKKTS